nr:glypican [Hymenolepis microstoma]
MLLGMSEASEHEIGRTLKNLLETNAENFRNDTITLKAFVIDTLGTTMEQLHSQLRRDFAYKFRLHEQFFINFFTTIQSYISGNSDDLSRLVTAFFDELLMRMTQILLNTNNTDAHLRCVVDALRSKQPFLRIPSIIINMTMEAFPPIRTAINAMAFARETLIAASITVHTSQDCFAEYHRLRFCSLCAGIISANACESSCDRLAEICTLQQLALGPVWKRFINILQEVMDLLDKFPKVHRPLQMHLTDAIMNLKSVYTMHEQEIMLNCSTIPPHSGGISNTGPIVGDNPGDRWPYGGNLRRSRRQLPPPSSYYKPPSIVLQQPSPPTLGSSRPLAFETRPLPSVSLAEQGIAILQSWVKETKQRYNKVANLFDNLGSELCFSKTIQPLFGSNRMVQSNSCWNGSALVPKSSRKPNSRRGYLTSISDPTLRQKDTELKKAVNTLQHVARAIISDPEALPLMDPVAILLKVGKNEIPVNSDEEALRSYLFTSDESGQAPIAWGGQASPPPISMGDLGGGFVLDTEGGGGEFGSGYPGPGDVSGLYGNPFGVSGAPTTYAPFPTHPVTPVYRETNGFNGNGVEDDEDFQQLVENSGYEPTDVYAYNSVLQTEVTPPGWLNQFQHPIDSSSRRVPINPWDTEGSGDEPSSIDHRPGSWKVDHQIKPPTEEQQQPPVISGGSDSAGAGLVVGEVGKLDIPDQIWVPESGGVEQHYPGPINPRATTTSVSVAPVPSLLLITISFVLLLSYKLEHINLKNKRNFNEPPMMRVEDYSEEGHIHFTSEMSGVHKICVTPTSQSGSNKKDKMTTTP